jgi:hypothetical protein
MDEAKPIARSRPYQLVREFVSTNIISTEVKILEAAFCAEHHSRDLPI